MKLKYRHFEAAKDSLETSGENFWNVLAAVADQTLYRRGPKANASPEVVIEAIKEKDDRRLNALTGGSESLASDWMQSQTQARRELAGRTIPPEREDQVVDRRAAEIMAEEFKRFQTLRPEARKIRREMRANEKRQTAQDRMYAQGRPGRFAFPYQL